MAQAATHPRPLPGPRPVRARQRPGLAALLTLGLAALLTTAVVTSDPLLAAALPASAVAAVACTRWPAAGLVSLFTVTTVYGSLQAYEHLSSRPIANFLLLSLWLAVLWHYATGRQRPVWLWPGLLILPMYVGLTAAEIFTANTLNAGLQSFMLSALPMTGVLLVAIAPWSQETLVKVVKGVLLVAAIVGAYNLLRWAIGPSAQEAALARTASAGVPHHIQPRFYGSFPLAQSLASWAAIAVPFALAFALAWRGRWRLVAIAATGTGGFVLVATSVLTATFAVIGGVAVVVLLYALAPAFPGGRRLAAGVLVTVGIAVLAGAAYTLAVSGSDRSSTKYSHLLDPTSDPTFQKRQQRWDEALADVDNHPFGRGLGTTGAVGGTQGSLSPTVTNQLDSSYVKIAFEQGIFVLALFVLGLIALLGGIAHRALNSPDPARVAIAIGACGVLVSMMAQFFGGFYIERLHMVAGWLLVGLGVAQFTSRRRATR